MNSEAPPIPAIEEDKIQWNSPIFVISILVALLVVGIGAVSFLVTRTSKEGERLVGNQTSPTSYPVGVPLDGQKATTELNNLIAASDQNNLLVTSSLRTTHTGFLADLTRPDATNPSDIALILDLEQPDGGPGATFRFTLGELSSIRWFEVTRNGTTEMSLDQLQAGFGLSITRVANLMNDDNPDEITVEVTKQAWEE